MLQLPEITKQFLILQVFTWRKTERDKNLEQNTFICIFILVVQQKR